MAYPPMALTPLGHRGKVNQVLLRFSLSLFPISQSYTFYSFVLNFLPHLVKCLL